MSALKKKEKRSRSSSKDANNSFVSNVTSRVTGLLPASITNWFSSPSSSSANGSAPIADTDSSGDEAAVPASPSSLQPPSKRMRLSPPTEYNHYDVTESNCVSTIETVETRSTTSTVQSPPGRNTFRWETNFVSTPLRSTETSDSRSDKDNMIPKSPSTQHTVSSGPLADVKRKSLFDVPNSVASKKACAKTSCNSPRDPNAPCFKPSLLGSPFYPGRTMYGGANNYFVYQPNIRQRKDRVVNTLNTSMEDNSISHSARRIMDLLENYSSPLNDSRRLQQYTHPSIHSISNTSFDSSSPSPNKAVSYKTQELHVPSIASVMRLKQRCRLNTTTTMARQIINSHSSTAEYHPNHSLFDNRDHKETSNNTFMTKVKKTLIRPKRGEQKDIRELPAPVNLPTAVLQIDQFKLPKLSLDPPKSVPMPTSRPPLTATVPRLTAKSSANTNTKSDTLTSANFFKFSSPVRISVGDSAPPAAPSCFTFGSPKRTIDPPKDSGTKNTPKPVESKESTDQPKDWQCSDCWLSNKPKADVCVCCGGKRPAAKSSKSDVKVNLLSKPVKKADGTWKCGDCWVSNDAGAAQCVCCGGARPGEPATRVKPITLNHVGDQWKCPDCWIQNKKDVTQCVACRASRPGVKTQTTETDSLKIIAKSQTDKWECPNCLVRVDNDKTKCVCCETEKPGLTTASRKTSFNFGMTAPTGFKFGIPHTQATTSQPVENKVTLESKSKSEESETNNNVVAKTPSFTFGVPSKKPEDQADSVKKSDSLNNSTSKLNFSFGIPKSSAPATTPVTAAVTSTPAVTTALPVVKFGIPNKLSSSVPTISTSEIAKDKEKAQEVPQVTFTLPKQQEMPKPFANFFASPISKASQEKPSAVIASNTSANVKGSSNAAAMTVAASSASAAAPTPTFSFGTAAAGVIFAAPPVTAAAAFDAPASTTTSVAALTPAAPFFQKPELTTTTSSNLFSSTSAITITMFQKSEAPAATTAPLFSFGSNSISTSTKMEAPKFNFSFGSCNKTENPLFNPTPNTAADNTSTNKFTLPNVFGSGNSLTNSLAGVNGFPSAAPVVPATTSNALSSGGGLFSTTASKDNMWSTAGSAASSPFATIAPSSTPQKPPAFTFGASTPFNAGAAPAFGANTQSTPTFGTAAQSNPTFGAAAQTTPAFGAATQATPAFGAQTTPAFGVAAQSTPAFGATSTPTFGAASSTPAFGASGQTNAFVSSQQPSTNLFGMAGQNSGNQASPFGSGAGGAGGAAAPSLFSSAVGAQSGGLFGSSAAAAPTFGTPNPSQPPFEATSLTPAPAPAFNFTPQSSGLFGLLQQQHHHQTLQQQQALQGAGVYAFGAGGAGGGVQFNMGSGAAAQPGPRRVIRKAVRRTNARQ